MSYSVRDYLSGNIENAEFVSNQNIQDNFLRILCWFEAFAEISHMSPEEKLAIERKTDELFNIAISKLNEERSKA